MKKKDLEAMPILHRIGLSIALFGACLMFAGISAIMLVFCACIGPFVLVMNPGFFAECGKG